MMTFLLFSIPGLLLSVVVLWLVLLVRTREQQRVRRLLEQRQRRMKERRDHARLRYEELSPALLLIFLPGSILGRVLCGL